MLISVGTAHRSLLNLIRAAFICASHLSVFSAMPASPPPAPAPIPVVGDAFPTGISTEDRQFLERDLKSLGVKLASLRSSAANDLSRLDHFADISLFHKGIVWALRYETHLTTNDISSLHRATARGQQRANFLFAN